MSLGLQVNCRKSIFVQLLKDSSYKVCSGVNKPPAIKSFLMWAHYFFCFSVFFSIFTHFLCRLVACVSIATGLMRPLSLLTPRKNLLHGIAIFHSLSPKFNVLRFVANSFRLAACNSCYLPPRARNFVSKIFVLLS